MLRVLVFFFACVFASFLVAGALLLPSFFFADYKDRTVSNQAALINLSDANKYASSTAYIKNVNGMASALSYGGVSHTLMTDIIDRIVGLKSSGIILSGISLASDDAAQRVDISVSGTAESRDDLTTWYADLKGDGAFQNVVLPISSLIADSGAPFTITFSYPIK